MHYARGQRARSHKYIAIRNGRYIYNRPANRRSALYYRRAALQMEEKANEAKRDLETARADGRSLGDPIYDDADRRYMHFYYNSWYGKYANTPLGKFELALTDAIDKGKKLVKHFLDYHL